MVREPVFRSNSELNSQSENPYWQSEHNHIYKGKGKGKWIYIAPLLQAHTQCAPVWITQFHLQITPYLPLPRKRSSEGATMHSQLSTFILL